MDVITNDVLKKALRFSGKVGTLASEEEDAPVSVDEKLGDKYLKEKKLRGIESFNNKFLANL